MTASGKWGRSGPAGGWAAGWLVAATLGGCVGDFPAGGAPPADGAPRADGPTPEVPDGRGGAGGDDRDLGRPGDLDGGGLDGGSGDGMRPGTDAEVAPRPDFDPPADRALPDGRTSDGAPLDADAPDGRPLDAAVGDAAVGDVEVGDAEGVDGGPPLPWVPDPDAPLRWREVHAGKDLSCGLRTDGRAHCWGDLDGGARAAPVDVLFSTLSVHHHITCGLVHPTGVVRCWGTGGDATDPLPAFEAGGFTSVATGRNLACGLKEGALFCAGDPVWLPPAAPPFNDGITRFEAVAVGKNGGCALDRQGAITCFGAPAGLLAVPEGRYAEVAVGEVHACAVVVPEPGSVHLASTVLCWGTGDERTLPPFGEITRLASNHRHTCGLRSDGAAACWGDGGEPLVGAHGVGYRRVSAGHEHNCAVNREGVGFCWGGAEGDPAMNVPLPSSF